MSGLRGFGLHIDLTNGSQRQWYAGANGIKRWADTDEPFTTHNPDAARSQRDDLEAIEGLCALPDIARPDDLDVIHMDNEAIEDIRDSHERAEITGQFPRMDYGTIAEVEADLKGICDERR